MLDIKFIRQHPEIVKKNLQKRGEKEKIAWVDDLLKKDEEYREELQHNQKLRQRRNEVTSEINELRKQGKDISAKIKEIKELPDKIKQSDEKLKSLHDKIDYYLVRIPNMLHETVPVGKDPSENKIIRKWGEVKKFDFDLKVHGDLIEQLDIGDFKSATKVSGTGFVYLKGALALLDLALQRFAIDMLLKKGFTLVEPPYMLGRKAYEGVVSLEDFEKVMYKIENEDLYLIATSEHPMVAMHKDDVFEEKQLPMRYCGVSACFRKEIGSHGVDTRGLFRMHQFNKVEQVVICKPEESWDLFEEIQKNSEIILQKLKIPYRVVSICTGDIGIIAAKKYDIEAWFPREKEYEEVTSCSNCTSYQAVRLNIRYKKGAEKEFVHTINNTGLATSRVMRTVLENYQQKDGSVKVPTVLVPYMNGMKKIERKNNE